MLLRVLGTLLWYAGGIVCLVALLLLLLFVADLYTYVPFTRAAKRGLRLGNVRYKDTGQLPAELDAIIIGSGQAGLSCGATLAQFGERVVVVEQHEVTGGGAHSFAVAGKSKWHFDAGLHITIPPHEYVLQAACGSVAPPVVFNRLADEHGASDYIALGGAPSGEAPLPVVAGPLSGKLNLEEELVKRFPDHAQGLRDYFVLAEAVQLRFGLLTATALLPTWARIAFLRSPFMALWRHWASKTAAAGLTECFPGDDETTCRLRSYMIGLWLDTGAPPSRGSFFMQTAVFGGWQKLGEAYPEGGPQETALAMVEAIEARDGAVFVRCPVARILRDPATAAACGVVLGNGDVIRARRVVSGLGYRATEALLRANGNDGHVDPPHAGWRRDLFKHAGTDAPSGAAHPLYRPPPRPLKTGQSEGFVMANIALNGTASELGITDATLWLQPGDVTNGFDALKGCEAFLRDPLGVSLELVPAGITFPSVKGSVRGGRKARNRNRTPQQVACQILVPGEWEWFAQYAPSEPAEGDAGARHAPPSVSRQKQEAYEALKARWSARMLALLHRHYPKTKGRVEFIDISTPLTLENYLWTVKGAAVGLDVTPQRFVDPDELQELALRHPRVPNLWRAGQDYLMCGQVLAAACGIITALRMRGVADTARFAVRVARLMLWPPSRLAITYCAVAMGLVHFATKLLL